MKDKIENGDNILIVYDENKRWVVQVREGEKFHTNKGIIEFDNLIGRQYGIEIASSKDRKFQIFAPTPADYLFKVIRKTQIIFPKDASYILIHTGIGPGSQVVEAGSGSGGLCSVLAYYVRPDGKVHSYEIREDFFKKAQKTIRNVGLEEWVELKNKDVLDGIDEMNMDAVVLDLPTPWEAIAIARDALKSGGFFASFSPTIPQIQNTVTTLKENHFGDILVSELIFRTWQITSRNKEYLATRPQTQMIGHTGFLIFAKKLVTE